MANALHQPSHMTSPATSPASFSSLNGLRYGLLGFPLAFCALPLYVLLPNLYAREFGVPLASLGAVLLGSRLFDAAIDPLLGRFCDRLYRRSLRAVLAFSALAALVLSLGFGLLFFPLTRQPRALLGTTALLLMLTYAAYSALAVAHQSWGAMLGGDEAQRSRIVAWREGLGLAGVVVAAVTPSLLGLPAMLGLFVFGLAAGWLAWTQSARPAAASHRMVFGSVRHSGKAASLWQPWRNKAFCKLIAVFMVNGIASAIPATLVLFFVQDRLRAPEAMQPFFLAVYFVCAAFSMPLWLGLVRRFGLGWSWLGGMALSIPVFLAALQLGAGDSMAFFAICALSGLALGSDLVLPGAMLAGVISRAGDSGRSEGAYFGWWNFATKLNLALAAGLALPLLQLAAYVPGARDAQALQALATAYCLLPCVLKAMAASLLYVLILQPGIHPREAKRPDS